MEEDVLIQNGLGRFFAAKLRSGVLFEIYQHTGNPKAGALALAQYKKAREAWATMAARANSVYRPDITYGDIPQRRGHWSDRLAGIDKDIAAMQDKLQTPPTPAAPAPNIEGAIRAATGRPQPAIGPLHAHAARELSPRAAALIILACSRHNCTRSAQLRSIFTTVTSIRQNAGSPWKCNADHDGYGAAIPGDYTNSVYPLQYYFELQRGADAAWLYPAFNATLSNQPYYAVAKRSSA